MMECPASLSAKSYFIQTRNFSRTRDKVGEGAYGVVYRGNYRGAECALKYIRSYLFQTASASRFSLEQFERECELAQRLSSPHIVRFVGVSFDRGVPVLLSELLECSLTDVLDCHHCSVPYHREMDIALGIARGIGFLHGQSPPIVHRDLSSNNILLAADYAIKIADLGVAKSMDNLICSKMPGTPHYMPPEVTQPCPLSVSIDLFSFAVLLVQLETREHPKPGDEAERVGSEEEEDGDEEREGEEREKTKRRERRTIDIPKPRGEKKGAILRVRSEKERRREHIQLMDPRGVLYRIVQCYLVEEPSSRSRTPLSEVMGWLHKETRSPRYTESVHDNPETPLEHRTGNHSARRGQPLSSTASSSLESFQSPGFMDKLRRKKKNKSEAQQEEDSGFFSHQRSEQEEPENVSHNDDGWEVVGGRVPSDSSGHGPLRSALYSLERVKRVLGLTTVEEDDSEYKLRVIGSL